MCLYDTVMVSDTTVLHDYHIPLSIQFYINIVMMNFFFVYSIFILVCFSHDFAVFISILGSIYFYFYFK